MFRRDMMQLDQMQGIRAELLKCTIVSVYGEDG